MIDELLPIIAEPLCWRPLGRLLCSSKSFYSNATLQTLYQTAMKACCDARPELASHFLGELKERYTYTRTFGGGEFECRKQVIRHYDVSDSAWAVHRMVLEFSDSFWFWGQRIAEIKAQPRPKARGAGVEGGKDKPHFQLELSVLPHLYYGEDWVSAPFASAAKGLVVDVWVLGRYEIAVATDVLSDVLRCDHIPGDEKLPSPPFTGERKVAVASTLLAALNELDLISKPTRIPALRGKKRKASAMEWGILVDF